MQDIMNASPGALGKGARRHSMAPIAITAPFPGALLTGLGACGLPRAALRAATRRPGLSLWASSLAKVQFFCSSSSVLPRACRYMTANRLDENDGTPEVLAADLQAAMEQLWGRREVTFAAAV